jgi:hypothetical protein
MTSQQERDETDNRAILEAWKSLTGSLPAFAADRISRGEVFYSALDLAEYLIGLDELMGWKVSFTSDGGPYRAELFVKGGADGDASAIEATHETSLTLAMTAAIRAWVAREHA